MKLLEINHSNVDVLLKNFNVIEDDEGFLVNQSNKRRIKCKYTGAELTKNNLGGILPGSNIFIADADLAYAGYIMDFLACKDE